MTGAVSKAYQLAEYVHKSFSGENLVLSDDELFMSGVIHRIGSTTSPTVKRIVANGAIDGREARQVLAKGSNGNYHLSTTYAEIGGERIQANFTPTSPDEDQEIVWDTLFSQILVNILSHRKPH